LDPSHTGSTTATFGDLLTTAPRPSHQSVGLGDQNVRRDACAANATVIDNRQAGGGQSGFDLVHWSQAKPRNAQRTAGSWLAPDLGEEQVGVIDARETPR
jgi:hypothetical protein